MQKAKVARTPKSLGQHMLQHQPQEARAGNGSGSVTGSYGCEGTS